MRGLCSYGHYLDPCNGTDTDLAECSPPRAGRAWGEFVTRRCVQGNSSRFGFDTWLANCTRPPLGKWINVTCAAGAWDTLGVDNVLASCTSAASCHKRKGATLIFSLVTLYLYDSAQQFERGFCKHKCVF